MFGTLLKQIGHRRTITPLFIHSRTNTYKRDVVSEDLDYKEYIKKLESLKNNDKILYEILQKNESDD